MGQANRAERDFQERVKMLGSPGPSTEKMRRGDRSIRTLEGAVSERRDISPPGDLRRSIALRNQSRQHRARAMERGVRILRQLSRKHRSP